MKSTRIALLLTALMLLTSDPGRAALHYRSAGDHPWCGTHPTVLAESQARHRLFQRRAERDFQAASTLGDLPPALATPTATKEGNVAVILDDADGSLISSSNLFDLGESGLAFRKKKKKIRAAASGAGISAEMGDRIETWEFCNDPDLCNGDDTSIEIDLAFKIRFYGTKYGKVYLNSDGNLTFLEADFESTPRDVSRTANGPPRIAAFFNDLDPSQTSGNNGDFVNNAPTFLRVTWVNVPRFGLTDQNTFQVTLFKSGKIVMAYGTLSATEAIIGTTPGRGAEFDFVDFTEELPFGPTKRGILERFTTSAEIDDLAVASAFFDAFQDIYSHLVIWVDFPIDLGGAFAFHLGLRNQVMGIGRGLFDFSDLAGSNGVLDSYLNMGSLANYPADPDNEFLGTNSTLEVLGQEAGHRWGSFVQFIDADGRRSNDLLGRALAHWSFLLDSDASVLEGNDIRDNGDGTFTTVESTERFSRLDQYLMGLRPKKQVPDFFYVIDTSGVAQPGDGPQEGVTVGGTRVDVSIDQVIAAEGARVPKSADAPKVFKMAFILLAREGEPPTQESIDKLQMIRQRWQTFFKDGTDGKGKANTKLKLK
ncbi:MAG: hypothetical protein V3S30_03710 [Thermoanaerobaculia bacterium]